MSILANTAQSGLYCTKGIRFLVDTPLEKGILGTQYGSFLDKVPGSADYVVGTVDMASGRQGALCGDEMRDKTFESWRVGSIETVRRRLLRWRAGGGGGGGGGGGHSGGCLGYLRAVSMKGR